MTEAFTQILVQMGLPGLVIFGLGWAVIKLDRRNTEIQDKRLEETKVGFDALNKNTTALNTLTDAISKLRRAR